jgi:hypothetical protein
MTRSNRRGGKLHACVVLSRLRDFADVDRDHGHRAGLRRQRKRADECSRRGRRHIVAPLFGWILDRTGSWTTPFTVSLGLLLFGAVMTCWFRPDHPLDALPNVSSLAVAE